MWICEGLCPGWHTFDTQSCWLIESSVSQRLLGGRDSRVEYLLGARSYLIQNKCILSFNSLSGPVRWVACHFQNSSEVAASHNLKWQASIYSRSQLSASPLPLPCAAPSSPREAYELASAQPGFLWKLRNFPSPTHELFFEIGKQKNIYIIPFPSHTSFKWFFSFCLYPANHVGWGHLRPFTLPSSSCQMMPLLSFRSTPPL